jgi:rare lipoprotein A
MKASWYSEWALKRDGQWDLTHGRTANGQLFADHKLTAASWKYFGKTVKITRTDTKASVVVLVNDRTARRFKGKRIDLSIQAMREIDGIKQGIVPVQVEEMGQ